jgi:hypothetical protein
MATIISSPTDTGDRDVSPRGLPSASSRAIRGRFLVRLPLLEEAPTGSGRADRVVEPRERGKRATNLIAKSAKLSRQVTRLASNIHCGFTQAGRPNWSCHELMDT